MLYRTKIMLMAFIFAAFVILTLINMQYMMKLQNLPSYISPQGGTSPAPSSFDPTAKPKYVKHLPRTINPAIFAEAEKRLMNCDHLYNKSAGPLFLAHERGEWKYNIRGDWYMLMELIRCKVPFTFTRQSDGEHAVIKGIVIGNNTQAKKLDKWEYKGGQSKLSMSLQASLDSLPPNNGIIIQGFVCPGIYRHILDFQVNATAQSTRFITSTYVFHGCNFGLTYKFMNEVVLAKKLTQPVIIITNKDCMYRESILRQWATEVYYLPDEFPTYWEEHGDMIMATFSSIARAYTGALFLISGGPGSPPIQIAMSRANPWNQYISFGSALELWTKGKASRGGIHTFDPQCHLAADNQCVFRKHPITGQTQTKEEYLAEGEKLGLNNVNILDI